MRKFTAFLLLVGLSLVQDAPATVSSTCPSGFQQSANGSCVPVPRKTTAASRRAQALRAQVGRLLRIVPQRNLSPEAKFHVAAMQRAAQAGDAAGVKLHQRALVNALKNNPNTAATGALLENSLRTQSSSGSPEGVAISTASGPHKPFPSANSYVPKNASHDSPYSIPGSGAPISQNFSAASSPRGRCRPRLARGPFATEVDAIIKPAFRAS